MFFKAPLFAFVLLLILTQKPVLAQGGMSFDELTGKLSVYFADELLADLPKSLPRGIPYRIWGWDVGDFTGDGYNDLALSIYISTSRKRECQVYLFGDIDGYLVNVATYAVPFIELPLEVGVVIKDTTCYIARKRRDEDWSVKGYRFYQGSIILVDEFRSNKVLSFDHETYRNYRTLETRETFADRNGKTVYDNQYITIPCYDRMRQLYAGTTGEAHVWSIRNVRSGSFWWKGETDASFRARLVYDANYVYVRVTVIDSNVVTGWCDTCAADRLEVWFETNMPDECLSRTIERIDKKGIVPRKTASSGIYGFVVTIGDFEDKRPSVRLKTTDDVFSESADLVSDVRVVTAQHVNGYTVKLRIPLELLGFAQPPVQGADDSEIGCTIMVVDVDNDFRPEETTIIASSSLEYMNPSTYGGLRFIPAEKIYGEATNFYVDAVIANLRELGF